MDRLKKAMILYKDILYNNNIDLITYIYIIFCLEQSLNTFDMDLIIDDDEKERLTEVIHDYYIDTDIQITEISDIIINHYNDFKNNDNFNIYDYVNEFY